MKLFGRDVKPHKATCEADFGGRTVLTNSPWEYVKLWLQRRNDEAAGTAAFYWTQAKAFAAAAQGLPNESAPLPLYYCYMNAAKALLASRGMQLEEFHGVTRATKKQGGIDLHNEGVMMRKKGILPMLSRCLGESEADTVYSLYDLLFNLLCIHRTFCITYDKRAELFIPLTNCRYVFDPTNGRAHFAAQISSDFDCNSYLCRLPKTLVDDSAVSGDRSVRSSASVKIESAALVNSVDINGIKELNRALRPDVQYIAGSTTLWYAKAQPKNGERAIRRSPLTISLAAMHRLSELSRYSPMQIAKLFSGHQNWLLSEFIQMSLPQFIDEMAAEITGHQCMTPNVRPAS
ncbi:YaaC family protein [Rubrivivax gelatinosus]|uniref:YaaC family protein n=1 Tax=Rubrivivax gelatinosus TaxID=28068 RepID=UPI001A9DCFB6|nr:YaaC family protein [Rubrivivax gelatinosus]